MSFDGSRSEDPVNQEKLIETQLALIHNHLDSGQSKLALQSLRVIEKEYQNNPKILNTGGLVHLSLNNVKAAVRYFEKAYELQRETMIGLNLSSAYLADKRSKDARNLLLKLVKNKKYDFRERVFHNLGLSYEEEGSYKNALRYYNLALEQNPVFYQSALQMAKVYKAQDKKNLMVKSLVKAASFCPLCLDPISELASYYAQEGEREKATKLITHFLKYKKITPQDRKQALALSSRLALF